MVTTRVNMHLAELSETYNSSFLEDLWMSIEEVVKLKDCEIYSYVPDMEEDPFSEGNLWTFNYLFFNKTLKRILYFTCIATNKYTVGISASQGSVLHDEDDDIEMDGMGEEDEALNMTTDSIIGEWEEEI
eukprot:FR741797.1.p1 GENE.FR741797.1~~FR741797.1.p1  ORF type:complete len:130 (+),score=24.64 FR741797.1:1-390(+)